MRSRIVALALVAAAIAVVAPEARAQDTYYACYVPHSGTVYRIKVADVRETCAGGHVEFSWKESGPPGPEGPVGPQGPIGPEGPQGPAGAAMLTGVTLMAATVTLPTGGLNPGHFSATCPAGKSVVSFGWDPGLGKLPSAIFRSRPAMNGSQIVWGFLGEPGKEWTFYWVCADAAPATFVP